MSAMPAMSAGAAVADRVAAVRIGPEEAGRRLDAWLADRFTYHSRSEWQRLIAEVRIRVNDAPARPSRLLRLADEIRFEVGYLPEPPVSLDVAIVHDDPLFLAVNKPAPLPCHPAGPFFRHTLWHLLRERYGVIHLVNRLDRETSGLVLVARNPRTAATLATCEIRKTYLVVVAGRFPEALDAEGWLMPDENCDVRKKRRFLLKDAVSGDALPAEAETARTRFRRRAESASWSLLEAELDTGRTHQIRATLCSLGYPVLADKLYGPDPRLFLRAMTNELTSADRALLILPHQALHAWRLAFAHPGDGSPVAIAAPLPQPLNDFCISQFGSEFAAQDEAHRR